MKGWGEYFFIGVMGTPSKISDSKTYVGGGGIGQREPPIAGGDHVARKKCGNRRGVEDVFRFIH